MRSLVVFLAACAVACASQVLLDAHGRPLEPAAVVAARALHLQAKALEHAPLLHAPLVHAPLLHAPAAVSHQSRVDVHSSPALLTSYAAAPVYAYNHHPLAAHAHYLKKRSLAVGHYAYAAPAAVSHQSRVDVVSSPAVSHVAYAAPHVTYAAPAVHAYVAPSAVSHQSRVDVHSSPAVVSTYAAAPLYHAYSHGYSGHYLKKRSLALTHVAYAAPSAVSHQSRVDVVSSPAVVSHAVAPVYAHAVAPVYAHAAPSAVSHQSRVDVHSSPVHHGYAPLAHSYALHSAPLAYSSPLVHAW